MTGPEPTVPPQAITLQRRTLPDSLRYLANYLFHGGHWSPVALVLRTLADEQEAAAPHLEAVHNHGSLCPGHREPDCAVCQQITEEVAAERERCAQLAEEVAAERERCAHLAEQVDAFYDAPCPDGVPDCVHQDTPFADLLRQGAEGGTDG